MEKVGEDWRRLEKLEKVGGGWRKYEKGMNKYEKAGKYSEKVIWESGGKYENGMDKYWKVGK